MWQEIKRNQFARIKIPQIELASMQAESRTVKNGDSYKKAKRSCIFNREIQFRFYSLFRMSCALVQAEGLRIKPISTL